MVLPPCHSWKAADSGKESARLVVEKDGLVTVHVGSSVLGQGLETTLAQVAADALGLPFERVRVRHGSTTHLREGVGSFASRSMVVGGSAVLDGCGNLLDAIRRMATQRFGFSNAEIAIADGWVSAGEKRAPLADFAGVEAEGSFASAIRTYSYGAHACHVAVDPRTMAVEIIDYVAVEDVGRAINPLIVHGQAIGALVQGLGGVFLDRLIYDGEAQMLNASLADYLVPTAWISPTCVRSPWSCAAQKPIRSAPRVQARAAWWRWPRPLRMRLRRRFVHSASRFANCRCPPRSCGSCSMLDAEFVGWAKSPAVLVNGGLGAESSQACADCVNLSALILPTRIERGRALAHPTVSANQHGGGGAAANFGSIALRPSGHVN